MAISTQHGTSVMNNLLPGTPCWPGREQVSFAWYDLLAPLSKEASISFVPQVFLPNEFWALLTRS